MKDIKHMNDAEIYEVISTCHNELNRRLWIQREEAAKKALSALEELAKIAPNCHVDMGEELNWYSVYLDPLVKQWKAQNFYVD